MKVTDKYKDEDEDKHKEKDKGNDKDTADKNNKTPKKIQQACGAVASGLWSSDLRLVKQQWLVGLPKRHAEALRGSDGDVNTEVPRGLEHRQRHQVRGGHDERAGLSEREQRNKPKHKHRHRHKHICTHTRTRVHTRACTGTRIQTQTHVRTYTRTHGHTDTRTRTNEEKTNAKVHKDEACTE